MKSFVNTDPKVHIFADLDQVTIQVPAAAARQLCAMMSDTSERSPLSSLRILAQGLTYILETG